MLHKKKTYGAIIVDLVQEVKALHARGDFNQAQRLILDTLIDANTHMLKHIVLLQDQLAAALEDKAAADQDLHEQSSVNAGLRAVISALIEESRTCRSKSHHHLIYCSLAREEVYEEAYQQALIPF